MVRANALSRTNRIRKKLDFKKISENGRRCVLNRIVVLYQPNESESSRLGISVSREVGGSVLRSRCKRLIREFFRKNKNFFRGLDLHVIVRPKRGKKGVEQDILEAELLEGLEQSRVRVGKAT